MDEMKNCPFCGRQATELETWTASHSYHGYRVRCTACDSAGGKSLSEEQAIKNWNSRREAHPSVQITADAYDDLRNATPEELLEAAAWYYRQAIRPPEAADDAVSFLHIGFILARHGGWERVAPLWLRESRKLVAMDEPQ